VAKSFSIGVPLRLVAHSEVEVQTSVGYAQPTVPIKTHEAVIMKVSNS
jgi:hypothetical protein